MIELLKFTKPIEEKLTFGKKDLQNSSQMEDVIIDSFILGFMQGKLGNSYQQYEEFLQNLQIVQQLRQFIDINMFQTNQLIEVYNNVFIERRNLSDQFERVEQNLFSTEIKIYHKQQVQIEIDHKQQVQIEIDHKQQVQGQSKQEEPKNKNYFQSFDESQLLQNFQLKQIPISNSTQLQQTNSSSGFNNPAFQNTTHQNQSIIIPKQQQLLQNPFQFFPLTQFSHQSVKSATTYENFKAMNSNSEINPLQKSNQFEFKIQPKSSSIYQFSEVKEYQSDSKQNQSVKQNEVKPPLPFSVPSPIKQQFQQSSFIQNQQSNSSKQVNPFNNSRIKTNQIVINPVKKQSFYQQHQQEMNKQFQPQQFQQQKVEKNDTNSFMVSQLQQIRSTQNINQFQQQELRMTNNIKKMQTISKPVNSNSQKQMPEQIPNGQFEQFEQLQQFEDESVTLAKSLQQQFDLENIQMECEICLEPMQIKDMMILNCCSQSYHSACLNQSFLVLMQQRQFPLNCPNLTCKKPIQYDDLSQILDEKGLEDYQQLTFQAYIQSHGEEYSWCPTPDCKYVFAQGDENRFDCPVCNKSYCLKCQADFHHGLSCMQYKVKLHAQKYGKNEKVLDEQFLQFVKGAKFKQCPQCKFWVEKNKGCDHMTCRCKFEFCYVCGGKYKYCKCLNNINNEFFPRQFQFVQNRHYE